MPRLEHDFLGEMRIPSDTYYGIQTYRAVENFPISGVSIASFPELIKALGLVKKASAIANMQFGVLPREIGDAICAACDEIIEGKLHDQFPVDCIQGGAGTSTNMNANEVIANRALELLGHKKGEYEYCHPNNHVNCSQSTNDIYPTALRIALYTMLGQLTGDMAYLQQGFAAKSEEFSDVIKMGRTQLQDAVPIRLGQEFRAYSRAVRRDIARFERAKDEMRRLNMGGTAIGTGINADETYLRRIVPVLSEVSGMALTQAGDLIDSTQNPDPFVAVSGAVKTCAVTLSKIANDLRLMSSGPRTGFGEINLPARQNGSSIMPGKVNPVIPEVINQVAFLIIGNDMTVTMAAEGGQLELNAFEPIIFYCLFQSIGTLTYAVHTFVDNCVTGITANEERCRELVESSVGVITALTPHIGYQHAADIAKRAIVTGQSVRKLILQEKLLTEEEIDTILDPMNLTKPGIPGKELLAHK